MFLSFTKEMYTNHPETRFSHCFHALVLCVGLNPPSTSPVGHQSILVQINIISYLNQQYN